MSALTGRIHVHRHVYIGFLQGKLGHALAEIHAVERYLQPHAGHFDITLIAGERRSGRSVAKPKVKRVGLGVDTQAVECEFHTKGLDYRGVGRTASVGRASTGFKAAELYVKAVVKSAESV